MNTDSLQIYDWYARDEDSVCDTFDSDVEDDDDGIQKFVAYVFAKSTDAKNVCVKINGYTP